MDDFRAFFDLRKLSDQDLGCLEYVLNSPAYVTVFKPYLETMRDSMNRLWLDRSQDRKDKYPDDFLAGGIASIDGLLTLFQKILEETNLARMHDAVSGTSEESLYDRKREQGLVQPVVGINQNPEPIAYDPDKDY